MQVKLTASLPLVPEIARPAASPIAGPGATARAVAPLHALKLCSNESKAARLRSYGAFDAHAKSAFQRSSIDMAHGLPPRSFIT